MGAAQLAASLMMLGLYSLGAAANAEAVPANDDFLAAVPLAGPPLSVEFDDNEGATKQGGEPDHAGNAGGHSVWYSWTPSVSADVVVSTCTISPGIDTLLAVYTGSAVDDLTPVVSNDERAEARCHSTDSEVAFEASAGTTYRIAVDGKGGSEGEFELVLKGPAPNDGFDNAETIGSDASVSGTTDLATRETGEPNHAGFAGAHSVWYSWTPSANGEAVVSTCVFFGELDTLLAVYTGSAVDDLTPVASSDDGGDDCGPWTDSETVFDVSADTTYRIAVDGKGGSAGDFELLLQGPSEGGDEGPADDDAIGGEPAASPPPLTLPMAPPSALSPRPKPLRCKPGQRKRRLRGKVRCVKKKGKRRKPVAAR
jgi:hypothetical protein